MQTMMQKARSSQVEMALNAAKRVADQGGSPKDSLKAARQYEQRMSYVGHQGKKERERALKRSGQLTTQA